MRRKRFALVALLPLALSTALARPADAPLKPIDNKNIPVEDLAHSFFFHSDEAPEILSEIIGKEDVNRLKPELVEHRRDMKDTRKLAEKLQQLCRDLQSARTGEEFAAVFIKGEGKERNERQTAARRILSKLDPDDKKALEDYLDTEYRETGHYTQVDYLALFASAEAPFPSARTAAITNRTCSGATKAAEMARSQTHE